ncbi:hypothetical protein [Kitasatospora sp. MBT66]|uniref:hypothetical protein n=1 Tax=Kitasatospora sp. MBT66 TaxID=1444769 RepID=UPI0005B90719|nr:hypothetical protein [Kitasatospora sp. MBT66]
MTTPSSTPSDTLVLSLLDSDSSIPESLDSRYWEIRKTTGPGGPAAVLAALEELAAHGESPSEERLSARMADARLAAEAVGHDHYISAPSTTPGTEGNRIALDRVDLRRRVFALGRDHVELRPDGALTLRYRGGGTSTYHPVTVAELEQFMDGNRRRMEEVAALGERVRVVLRQADPAVAVASRRSPVASGVDVHVGGGTVSVFWWSATWEEQLADRAPGQPWANGLRDQVAALLLADGIRTEPDRDALKVIAP